MDFVIMKKLALLCLLLAGCGIDKEIDNNNHGYGYHYDAIGAGGLKLRYTPTLESMNPFADPNLYEAAFAEVQVCVQQLAGQPGIPIIGTVTPQPFIIIVPFGDAGYNNDGTPAGGRYYSNPSLIIVTVLASNPNWVWHGSYKHEMIHYLLDYWTGDRDNDHSSLLFSVCS